MTSAGVDVKAENTPAMPEAATCYVDGKIRNSTRVYVSSCVQEDMKLCWEVEDD